MKPLLILSFFFFSVVAFCQSSELSKPDTVTFVSGNLKLKGLLWKPKGNGPFPAVLYNHGSEKRPEKFLEKPAAIFLEHGYAFFAPCRRGQGLSKDQGKYIIDELDSASKAGGLEARVKLMIHLHETSQLQDQLAALECLKRQPRIDANRVGAIGISFGGMQTMLMATQKNAVKAALNFAGAAMMWEKSPKVGEWMKQVAAKATVPVYFIQAENDFSIKPSLELSEEMKNNGKPYLMKIFPPRGTTPMEGHTFIDATEIWAPIVFPEFDKWMGKKN